MSKGQHVALASIWLAILVGSLLGSVSSTSGSSSVAEGAASTVHASFAEDALFGEGEIDFGFTRDSAASRPQLLAIEHEKTSSATLRHDNRIASYTLGESIGKDGPRLARILDNGVLIDRAGAYELLCCVAATGRPSDTPSKPVLLDLRRNPAVTQLARAYHSRLYINPLSLMGRVKIVHNPAQPGRYKLYPGTDERAFRLFGLRPGDELLAVNGIAVASASAVPVLYERLAGASHIAATLRRANETIVVVVSLETSG